MKGESELSAFGQADPTDGRVPLDWRSKYSDPAARREIRIEAIYLGCLLLCVPIGLVVLWLEYPKRLLGLSDAKFLPIMKYGLAWVAGTLGGTLYDIKWLYHTVARRLWHMDRRLWRLFTPHISGGLAFAVVALVASGGLKIFDAKATESSALVVGLSFLVGYFSDSAFAKLMEISETLFGTVRAKEKHVDGATALTASAQAAGTSAQSSGRDGENLNSPSASSRPSPE
jgi:hypothetical protein